MSRVMAAELRLRNLMGLPPADGWNIIPTSPPDLALIDNDSIIGEQRDECVEVASSLGGKVTGDDLRGRDSQDSSFQQRPRSRGQARDVHPW